MLCASMKINNSYNLVSIEISIQTIFKMRCSIENFLSKTKM